MGLNTILNLGDSRGQGNAAMNRDEIVDLINAILGSALNPGIPDGGDVIVIEEFGQFYRQISGANEGQTVFPLEFKYTVNSFTMAVYVNGVLQVQDLDYTETDDLTITFLTPLTAVDTCQFKWSKTITAVPTNVYLTKTTKIFSDVAGQTTFPISYNPGNLDVYLNGVKLQRQEDYAGSNGTDVVLTTPVIAAEDVVEIIAFSDFSIANHWTKEESYAKDETYNSTEVYNTSETYTKAEIDALISSPQVSVPIGSIVVNASSIVDTGYFECNGGQVSRTTYSGLFAKIGTVYGAGNGLNTFNLPDLRGEFLRGWDNSRGQDVGRGLGSPQDQQTIAPPSGSFHTTGDGSTTGAFSRGITSGKGKDQAASGVNIDLDASTQYPAGSTGSEIRPRNITMMYQIKY
jgi:microcystin-dependent protein